MNLFVSKNTTCLKNKKRHLILIIIIIIIIQLKFYSHQLMHFFIQLCISILSYIKIT